MKIAIIGKRIGIVPNSAGGAETFLLNE